MFYFYPKIYYKINSFDYLRVTDISVYSRIKQLVTKYGHTSLRPYTVQDGESPDLVSNRFYGNPKYDYIILILNDIRNVYDEWPRNKMDLLDYIEEKYGSLSYAQSNYANNYTGDGLKVSKDMWYEMVDAGKSYETYYDYEERLNREKGQIKVMSYNYAVKFEVELQEYLNNVIEVS